MTNKRILRKALLKAIKGGYITNFNDKVVIASYGKIVSEHNPDLISKIMNEKLYYVTIFSHEFAKALWGKGARLIDHPWYKKDQGAIVSNIPIDMQADWKYHLQQMVISEDPIKYLAKFI